jgi:prepilin-type N-terminal cleavage/methylation domain-containing protein
MTRDLPHKDFQYPDCRVVMTQSHDHACCQGFRNRSSNISGFTLLELILAMTIFSLVIGILSVSLTFSLRVWEKQQNQAPPEMPNILDLMKWQLANFDPTPIRIEDANRLIFMGNEHSLIFSTDRSVKAISRGAPVIVRYIFDPREKKLYYSEIPLDPYHPKVVEEFLKAGPQKDSQWPRFYSIDAGGLSLSYVESEDHPELKESWDNRSAIPATIIVKWSPIEEAEASHAEVMIPNSFFPKSREAIDKALAIPAQGGASIQ